MQTSKKLTPPFSVSKRGNKIPFNSSKKQTLYIINLFEGRKTEKVISKMDGVGSQEEASSSGSYFTPLLISMAGIVSTSLALVLYHFIIVRYCLRRSRMGRGLLLSNGRISGGPIPAPGVDDKILDTIPILSYSADNKANKLFRVDQSECAICLGELEDGDKVRLLPNCRHAFHVPCIDEWFSAHTNCPVCRSSIHAPNLTNSVVPLTVDEDDGVGNSTMTLFPDEELEGGEPVGGSRPVRSNGVLRHCVSVALPVEGKSLSVVTELKRSLSMDQSDHIVINIQTQPDQNPSSSSSSKPVLMRSRSYNKTRSMRKLDRMSSMITRSFSQLWIGRSSSRADGLILP